MARKRHGGLGRGLDALIPQARQQEKEEHSEAGNNVETTESAQDTGFRKTIETAEAADKAAAAYMTGNAAAKEAAGASGNAGTVTASDAVSAAAGRTEAVDPAEAAAGQTEAVSGLSETPARREEAGSGIRMLRLAQVDPNRSQPRQNFEDEALEELAESIRQFGVLQPILVQKKGSRYEIIAGERRWRASRKAGLKEIPAIVKEYSDQETLELSLIENIQRQDLNPIEEAKAFRRLLDEFGLRQEDLAVRVSKSRTAITNAVRLLKLDERVQDLLIRDQISMGHARALLPVEIPDEQFLLAQQVADKHLSVREVEKLVKTRLAGKAARKAKDGKKAVEKDPALELAYRTIEEQLKQSLGTRAVIRGGGDGTGRIEIDFYSNEDLEKIVDLLT